MDTVVREVRLKKLSFTFPFFSPFCLPSLIPSFLFFPLSCNDFDCAIGGGDSGCLRFSKDSSWCLASCNCCNTARPVTRQETNPWLSSGLPAKLQTCSTAGYLTMNSQLLVSPAVSPAQVFLFTAVPKPPWRGGGPGPGSPPPNEWWVEAAWALSRHCCAWR